MADEPRTFDPDTTEANRTRQQGGGVGQRELQQQQDPSGDDEATAPYRSQPFQQQKARMDGERLEPRSAAGREDTKGDLGAGTPANVDIHDTGEDDKPQNDWGEPREGAVHSANHTTRGVKTEAERGQGAKTRARNKEINSGGL